MTFSIHHMANDLVSIPIMRRTIEFRHGDGRHHLKLFDTDSGQILLLPHVMDWLVDQTPTHQISYNVHSSTHLHFETEKDYIHFKMRWL